MRNAILTLTFFAGLAGGAAGAAASTFPMSAEPDAYSAPLVGVELTAFQEGRSSALTQPPAEGIFGFADFTLPLDFETAPLDQ